MKNRLLFLLVCLSLLLVFSTDTLISQGSLKTLKARALPDLQVRFTAPNTAYAGQDIGPKIKMFVRNYGRGLAKGTKTAGQNGYMIDLVISKDATTPDGWATVSTTFKEDALLVGGRTSITEDLKYHQQKSYAIGAKIPANTPPGVYYLCMNVDPGKKITESKEKNNKYCRKITIKKLIIQPSPCAKRYPNPRIKFSKQDAQGRVYIPVVNAAAYSNILFKPAPKLPPCGANKNSSRTWVDIYDGTTNKRIYGFCALNSNAGLKNIWFMSKAKRGKVYIIINDRLCKRKYRSNMLVWPRPIINLCAKRYPNPRIKFEKQDKQGRVYIPVLNAAAYSNILFKPAPKLPPCGRNKNSSRTWVDIYNAKTNQRIYGFCALNSNAGLKKIWFMSKAKSGYVYIIIKDRLCKKTYRSNTLHWGYVNPCARRYPNPRIKFDKVDAQGRVYIPVINWAAYSNSMFAAAPTLPPCGANKNSSRTWVDIYDALTKKRLYGFCAFNSKDDLKGIWFKPNTRSGRVFIVINDRRCKRKYRSNVLPWRLR